MLFSEKDLFIICKENRDMENKFMGKKDFIKVFGGDKIDFWSLENTNAKCNLIFFQPNGGNVSFMADFFNRLSSGCSLNIYAFNYRGYGESTGEPTIENALEDSGKIIEEVYSMCNNSLPTILMGYSFGCFTCLNSPKDSEIENWIKGYVCVSPFSGSEDLSKVIEVPVEMEISPELERLDNEKAVRKITAPILFIHGLNDDFLPVFMSEKLYNICPSKNKKILLIEDAGHNDICEDKYSGKIVNGVNQLIESIK